MSEIPSVKRFKEYVEEDIPPSGACFINYFPLLICNFSYRELIKIYIFLIFYLDALLAIRTLIHLLRHPIDVIDLSDVDLGNSASISNIKGGLRNDRITKNTVFQFAKI